MDGHGMAGQAAFSLSRDAHGHLVLTDAQGVVHVGVVPVRAFPLSDAEGALSLVGADGHELAWVQTPASLPANLRALIHEALAALEFAPVIDRLLEVSTFATPSTWTVDTDRGVRVLVLRAEEDIRRLQGGALLVTDSHGIGYRIADMRKLDRRSRRWLERFL